MAQRAVDVVLGGEGVRTAASTMRVGPLAELGLVAGGVARRRRGHRRCGP
jgi:hypothetical protein